MDATVVITTRNRCEELRQALVSCRKQSHPNEVIVVDDASTDGTAEMVRREFPEVRLVVSETSQGYIVQRNRAGRMATGEFIFSMDDDAEFSGPEVIGRTLCDFEADSRIGAVAIPYIEPHKDNIELQRPPDRNGVWLTDSFIGTAHAVRRKTFLSLGGYREGLIHQGEECDFCIRMLDAGFHVRLGTSPPILHHESPKRDYSRMDYYGSRNSMLFSWQNVPNLYLPVHSLGTTLRCLLWSLDPARFKVRARGLMDAWRTLGENAREPVAPATYRMFRELRKRGPLPLGPVSGGG